MEELNWKNKVIMSGDPPTPVGYYGSVLIELTFFFEREGEGQREGRERGRERLGGNERKREGTLISASSDCRPQQ